LEGREGNLKIFQKRECMRKRWLLLALFCFLTLNGCGTVENSLGNGPMASRAKRSQGTEVSLPAYLQRLGGTKIEKQNGGVTVTIPSDSLFQPDSDGVKIYNGTDIDILAGAGKKYPQMKILVNAYTDCLHSETRNLVYSDLEAWLVKQALVDRGISAERITAMGWGESRPIANNATAEGRKANRRVTITFKRSRS
jgi:outer membrane protein OmpA-like peptidoglycan-associated protein